MKKTLSMLAIMSAVLVSCEKPENNGDIGNDNTEEQPETPTSEISVSPAELTFGAEGGEQVITITSSDKWTLDKSDDWCSASSYTGDNEDEIVIKVEPYDNTEESRETKLVFVCGDNTAELNIRQSQDEIIEFQDANFFKALIENNKRIDKNEDGKISKSEASVQKSIRVGRSNISNMDEIKYFTSLKELYCYENQLTSLNVSLNPNLSVLWCGKNQLESLDVSNNTALTELYCENNQLSSLDLSNNIALTDLFCIDNMLLTINVSKNTALTHLTCYNNRLSFLDVSNNTALIELYCYNNRFTTLDLSQCHALEYIECCQFSYSIDSNNNYQLYPDYDTKLPLKSLKIYKYHIINPPFLFALETFYGNVLEYVD